MNRESLDKIQVILRKISSLRAFDKAEPRIDIDPCSYKSYPSNEYFVELSKEAVTLIISKRAAWVKKEIFIHLKTLKSLGYEYSEDDEQPGVFG